MPEAERQWDGGWETDAAAKRRAWLALGPAGRLEWLEGALTFAADVGALRRDRRDRQRAADRWSLEEGLDTDDECWEGT